MFCVVAEIRDPISLSIKCRPSPSPALFILVIRSPMALMPSTCSARYSDSRKSQRWPSPLSPATLCRSRRLWLTVFSSSRAASMASSGVPHSMVVGLAMSWKTTLPPLLFWYSISFIPWHASSALSCSLSPPLPLFHSLKTLLLSQQLQQQQHQQHQQQLRLPLQEGRGKLQRHLQPQWQWP